MEILTKQIKKELDSFFEHGRGFFELLAKPVKPGSTFLDVGCGNGYIGLKVADLFRAKDVILTDVDDSLQVPLPENAQFHRIDVCSDEFLTRFKDKAQVVFSIAVMHELPCSGIFKAIRNFLSVLPIGGVAIIMDRTEQGWLHQIELCARGIADCGHLEKDIVQVSRLGLNTDQGIKNFWAGNIFPSVPGETYLLFNGYMYTVVYVAKQWGQVKPVPPEIEAQVRALGYI